MKDARATALRDIRRQKRLGTGLLVVGVLAIAAGIPFLIQARQFNASALRAPGKIVELHRQASGKDVSYFPVFSFVDQRGATNVVRSAVGARHTGYAVGDAVEVLYPADDPGRAKLNTFFSVWFWPALFGGGGLVLIIAGLVLWQGALSWLAIESAGGRKAR